MEQARNHEVQSGAKKGNLFKAALNQKTLLKKN